MVGLPVILGTSALLFAIGLYGALALRNAIRILMCIELMLNAVNINLVAFSRFVAPADPRGQVFTLFVITVAAAEAAVGLAIILSIARQRQNVHIDEIRLLKG